MGPHQYDWCPYKKRKLGQGNEQREDHVRIQEKVVIYKSRREASEETNLANT